MKKQKIPWFLGLFWLVLPAVVSATPQPDDWRRSFSELFAEQAKSVLWTAEASPSPGLRWLGVDSQLSYGYGRPMGAWADGAAWSGLGLNSTWQTGVAWSAEHVSVQFEPLIWASQNQAFDIPDTANPPYGDLHRGTWDHPSRMGLDPLWRLDGGQSLVRAGVGPFTASAGTANRVWGESRTNSLLLSANGPGVPSLELGVLPTETPFGTFEAHYLTGQLRPSGWQVSSVGDGSRLWSALLLAYAFPFLPDLTLSAARTAQSYLKTMELRDFLMPLTPGLDWGIDKFDQRVSLSYRWRFPVVGLELYGEWGRNDFSPDLWRWIRNFERTQAYVFGFRKGFQDGEVLWGFEGELGVGFLGPATMLTVYNPVGADFFTHSVITEGYTIAGQDLGAAMGNGNILSLAFVGIAPQWWSKAEVRRWVKDYSVLLANPGDHAQSKINVQYDLDVEHHVRVGDSAFFVGLTLTEEYSPFLQYLRAPQFGFQIRSGWSWGL